MHGFFMNGGKRHSPLAIVAFVVGGIVLAAAFALLFGWIVLLLWNWLMPEIFGLPRIGYWQAWGLVLLSHILVKGGFGLHGGPHGRHGHRAWKSELRGHLEREAREDEMKKAAAASPGAEGPTA